MQHPDRLTKVLLGTLVLFLSFVATRTVLDLAAGQEHGGSYDYIRYLGGFIGGSGAAIVLLDTRNGDVWLYGITERTVLYLGQLTELGQPLLPSHTPGPTIPSPRPWPIQYARLVYPAPAEPALP